MSGHLDLFSTSQTREHGERDLCYAFRCDNNAPFIAIKVSGKSFRLIQGSCNSWTCARCGQLRARKEYGRIVHGVSELAHEHDLYFITLTTRGRGLSVSDAHAGYLEWTNRLLTAMRTRHKRSGGYWCYVAVTEHQKRGHPHSHILTTYSPHDLRQGTQEKWEIVSGKRVRKEITALRSDWLEGRAAKSGLGHIYDISEVREPAAASRYVAKYLFKEAMHDHAWPKNWRRVRYSQNWPKLPEQPDVYAFPVMSRDDWQRLAREALVITPIGQEATLTALSHLASADCIIRPLLTE